MKICDRGHKEPKQATDTVTFEVNQYRYDLCSECINEALAFLEKKEEIGIVERLARKVGRPRKEN